MHNSETIITVGVEVRAEVFHLPEQSLPERGIHMFGYKIEITNHNSFTVQLLTRHWHITDCYFQHREVQGEGVVGRQPVLYAGDTYDYVSGCDMHAPIGKMCGTYTFINLQTREEFEVQIPAFTMTAPDVQN